MKKLLYGGSALLLAFVGGSVSGYHARSYVLAQAHQAQGKPPFNPRAGKKVETARRRDSLAAWTRRYRGQFPDSGRFLRAEYFGKDVVKPLLTGRSEGIRVYNALDSAGVHRLVLVGVDRNGKDLFTPVALRAASAEFLLYTPERCPANCDYSNALMK